MTTISANIQLGENWNIVPGISVQKSNIEIDVDKYFYRYENPSWRYVPWEKVKENFNALEEDDCVTLEQKCLEFVRENSEVTEDPSVILENAEKVYSYLFDSKSVDVSDLPYVTDKHMNILREASTLMALNNVNTEGRATNVGPAWFFPVCTQKVYGLTDEEASEVDELYHGGFFNENRRVASVKAHVALGGKLVHGCQGEANMAGGCVVSYGTSMDGFFNDLKSFRNDWMEKIRNW